MYRTSDIPNNEEFLQEVKDYACDYIKFCEDYNRFVSLFDSDHIQVVWDNKTIQLFKKYDAKETTTRKSKTNGG